ncbi:hypothetical protein [Brasilonema sp. UFV-L1]|uniref:hypothetical protein n=1 Tax=Brasilonema sp. UFV-L1 TaxID=2234130 RepID=UPI00145DEAB2|nr:hypothetical protein [Brasilonema sp. UFV-L1]NMG10872.1 hypothetical protein [Brasilonema sp. UFV-L1]
MRSAIDPKVGDKVLILRPAYVAGKVGVICDQEMLFCGHLSGRWLIRLDSEDIVVSLTPKEFKVVNDDFKMF